MSMAKIAAHLFGTAEPLKTFDELRDEATREVKQIESQVYKTYRQRPSGKKDKMRQKDLASA